MGCHDLGFGEFPDSGLETTITETNSAVDIETDVETETDSTSKIETDVETETNSASEIEKDVETETNSAVDIETDVETETNSASEIETDVETETNSASENDTGVKNDAGLVECGGNCFIGAICFPKGVVNPHNSCEICNPDLSSSDWSSNDGAKCDDGIFCNGNDTCENRSCSVNSGDPCLGDGVFCNGTETCDELNDRCSSSGDPCDGEDICIEHEDQCCRPNVPVGLPICNEQGDVVQYDSCGWEILMEDCLDDVHNCVNGVCTCPPGLQGENCETCVFRVKSGLADYEDHRGSSWSEPLETVQDGIERAKSIVDRIDGIDSCEVWVAKGIYRPTLDGNKDSSPKHRRSNTIQLESGVALYGGFTGDEKALEQRDFLANPTILSGDLNGDDKNEDDDDDDDDEKFVNNDDNVYHVVTGADNATIDGFIITGGNATVGDDNEGGGMLNVFASPMISNCVFQGNVAVDGAGMANAQSNPVINNCVFQNNHGVDGGGMKNTKSEPTVMNSLFTDNYAVNGAGMANTQSSPFVTGCRFKDNVANDGGGVKNTQSDSTFVNCVFRQNFAEAGGGLRNVNSDPLVVNCTFYQNKASKGGGMSCNNSSPQVTNCIFWDNEASQGAEIHSKNALPRITFSDVKGGCTVFGKCTLDDSGNIDSNPLFASDEYLDLSCSDPQGSCSPCVDAGNDDAVPHGASKDIAGLSRRVDGDGDFTPKVDMGAYEFR